MRLSIKASAVVFSLSPGGAGNEALGTLYGLIDGACAGALPAWLYDRAV